MDLGLSGTAFLTGMAGFWLLAVIGLSLAESGGDLHRLLSTWRFVFFEGPVRLVRGGADWLQSVFLGAEPQSDSQAMAQDLSDVLQVPVVDAELLLELSEAFFHPTDDPQLNQEAVELLSTANPRNETWRAQATECCRKLSPRTAFDR
jgi:hypothetical protein